MSLYHQSNSTTVLNFSCNYKNYGRWSILLLKSLFINTHSFLFEQDRILNSVGKLLLIPNPPCPWRIVGSAKWMCSFTAWPDFHQDNGDEPRNGIFVGAWCVNSYGHVANIYCRYTYIYMYSTSSYIRT